MHLCDHMGEEMREVSVSDLERAVQDLYKAIRLSVRMGSLYDIDGTAEVIANAVVELAKKRQSKEYIKKTEKEE